jgi:hypothetical protein
MSGKIGVFAKMSGKVKENLTFSLKCQGKSGKFIVEILGKCSLLFVNYIFIKIYTNLQLYTR